MRGKEKPADENLELAGDRLKLQTELDAAIKEKRENSKSPNTPSILEHLDAMRVKSAHQKSIYIETYPKVDTQIHDVIVWATGSLSPPRHQAAFIMRPGDNQIEGPTVSTQDMVIKTNLHSAQIRGKPPPETLETLKNKIYFVNSLR